MLNIAQKIAIGTSVSMNAAVIIAVAVVSLTGTTYFEHRFSVGTPPVAQVQMGASPEQLETMHRAEQADEQRINKARAHFTALKPGEGLNVPASPRPAEKPVVPAKVRS